ncbi:DUF1801 domain-containing protein [Sphingopyxis sp. L1A2A]|uniref:DUF1801 domain-containing protein n=1 Tax=Sphingopyxis sp. L1A2A TaxID=2502247 RepID=UPI00201626D7|nr:DUF1801 domain-containing protein [Sphingopyxis sp. L1A2A]
MAMGMGPVAETPDAYIAALSGWQRDRAEMMRAAIMDAAPFAETIKWTNLVFMANGPCILIRAEEHRVLLGFWRGKRLREIEPRIKASGKYELGNLVLTEATETTSEQVARLAAAAHRLNAELGNPAARA